MSKDELSSAQVVSILESLPKWIEQEIRTAKSIEHLDRLCDMHPPLRPAIQHVWAAVQLYIQARHAPRPIVEAHPELLTSTADAVLRLFAESQDDHGAKITIWAGQTLLSRCREEGIDTVWGD
jgi:hypothetical protein